MKHILIHKEAEGMRATEVLLDQLHFFPFFFFGPLDGIGIIM